jgi:hypothetical protein
MPIVSCPACAAKVTVAFEHLERPTHCQSCRCEFLPLSHEVVKPGTKSLKPPDRPHRPAASSPRGAGKEPHQEPVSSPKQISPPMPSPYKLGPPQEVLYPSTDDRRPDLWQPPDQLYPQQRRTRLTTWMVWAICLLAGILLCCAIGAMLMQSPADGKSPSAPVDKTSR